MGYKKLIEKHEISDMLMHKISLSTDEEQVFLNVEYDGRYKIEKTFKNNPLGLMSMQKFRDRVNSDEKLLNYLGLGETPNE